MARARAIKVTGHLCAIGFTEAADLGIDNLEHDLFVDTEFTAGKQPGVCSDTEAAIAQLATLRVGGPEIQGLIRHLVGKQGAVASTLPVFDSFVPGRAPQTRVEYLKTRERVAAMKDSPWPKVFQREMTFERPLVEAGDALLAGLLAVRMTGRRCTVGESAMAAEAMGHPDAKSPPCGGPFVGYPPCPGFRAGAGALLLVLRTGGLDVGE